MKKLSDYATHQFRRHSWTSRINLLMRFWGRGGAPKEQDAGQVGSHWAGVQEVSISVAERRSVRKAGGGAVRGGEVE